MIWAADRSYTIHRWYPGQHGHKTNEFRRARKCGVYSKLCIPWAQEHAFGFIVDCWKDKTQKQEMLGPASEFPRQLCLFQAAECACFHARLVSQGAHANDRTNILNETILWSQITKTTTRETKLNQQQQHHQTTMRFHPTAIAAIAMVTMLPGAAVVAQQKTKTLRQRHLANASTTNSTTLPLLIDPAESISEDGDLPTELFTTWDLSKISYPMGEAFKVKPTNALDSFDINISSPTKIDNTTDPDGGEDRRGLQGLSCNDPDILCQGWTLNPGSRLVSPNGQYHVEMQSDNNFVVYRQGTGTSRTPMWHSNTWNSGANKAIMQDDGNLVVYADTSAKWASVTSGQTGNWLRMQDDGNLVVYGSSGTNSPRWASNSDAGRLGGGGGPAPTPSGGGPAPTPSGGSDNPWLTGHNSRRQRYHGQYGVSYVPLKWTNSLAASAQSYANTLARTGRLVHSGQAGVGENLAWNSGRNAPSADSVMTRWTENEESSVGGHFTQVLWRATQYVGCGQASSSHGHYQVCHYVTRGNCNGSTRTKMLASSSPCSPQCPSEGCF
jgi:Cysteine-rich secretory protein family